DAAAAILRGHRRSRSRRQRDPDEPIYRTQCNRLATADALKLRFHLSIDGREIRLTFQLIDFNASVDTGRFHGTSYAADRKSAVSQLYVVQVCLARYLDAIFHRRRVIDIRADVLRADGNQTVRRVYDNPCIVQMADVRRVLGGLDQDLVAVP